VQAALAAPAAKKPAEHDMQALDVLAPARGEAVPAAHGEHAEMEVADGEAEYEPLAHFVQAAFPVPADHEPAGHGVHEAAPGCEKVPAGQTKHRLDDAPTALDDVPLEQSVQLPAPASGA
jgi:hypothetical protein